MNRILIASKLGSDDALHWDLPVGQAEAGQEMQGVLPASLQFLVLPGGPAAGGDQTLARLAR